MARVTRCKVTPRRVLVFFLAVLCIASSYRAIHYALAGFYVPDELGYVTNVWMSDKAYTGYFNLGYQVRYFFNLVNSAYFKLFQLDSIDKVVTMLPLYFLLWGSIGMLSAVKTLELLGFKEREIKATVLLAITIPVFMLFSVTFLTEPVAFAMCMFGIFIITRFRMRQDRWRDIYPAIGALAFAAAAYTRVDFVIFQLGGVLALLMPNIIRSKDLGVKQKFRFAFIPVLAYSLPAAFFLYFPGQLAQQTSSAVSTSVLAAATSSFSAPVSFVVALVASFNPVVSLLVMYSFVVLIWSFVRRRTESNTLALIWVILGMGIVGGIILIFYTSGGLLLSTGIRYAYDVSPVYFLVVPFGLSRIRGKRKFAMMVVGILIFAAFAANSFQGALQSNLGTKYPFLSGDEQFLLPSYRTPYAQLRDFFSTLHNSQRIYVVGDAELDQPCWPIVCYHKVYNLSSGWQNTPGTARIENIVFYGYVNASTLSNLRLKEFYLYIDKTDWSYFNSTNSYFAQIASGNLTLGTLPFNVTSVSVIYDRYDFFLAKVEMSYP